MRSSCQQSLSVGHCVAFPLGVSWSSRSTVVASNQPLQCESPKLRCCKRFLRQSPFFHAWGRPVVAPIELKRAKDLSVPVFCCIRNLRGTPSQPCRAGLTPT